MFAGSNFALLKHEPFLTAEPKDSVFHSVGVAGSLFRVGDCRNHLAPVIGMNSAEGIGLCRVCGAPLKPEDAIDFGRPTEVAGYKV